MLGFPRRSRKEIGARIDRWEPLVLERVSHGWRATKLTRSGRFTATAVTVHAARMAAATRAQESYAL